MDKHLVVQRPAGEAKQLMLLFHGVGATPQDLVPLGERLAQTFPEACIVSVQAPFVSDLGQGYQWFSVQGITEENRVARVGEVLPQFIALVQDWQRRTGVAPEATALFGFSQGGIMALEASQLPVHLAGRIVALAGRFAQMPQAPHALTTLHLLHGKDDAVIHYGYTVTAAQHLVDLGADITADVLPFVGHTLSDDMLDLLLERLQGHVPKRIWEAAQTTPEAAPPSDA
ncbi:MAG: esterase [Rhodoferax sp.]|nr:esterase [Rhodoferax sp.]